MPDVYTHTQFDKNVCLQVVLAGLELANALVASDASVMETMCLVGIVPTVARFATATWAKGIRLQAARFVQQLCRTSLATAQMFVACQVCTLASHCALESVGSVCMLYMPGILGLDLLLPEAFHLALSTASSHNVQQPAFIGKVQATHAFGKVCKTLQYVLFRRRLEFSSHLMSL